MTKTTTAFLFAASLLFTTACDPAEEPTTERAAELDSEIDAPADDEAHGDKHGRGKHQKFAAEKLCSELECTEAQAAQISELFAGKHEGRDEGDREARKAARAESNKLIAAAFRADSFDVAVLERAKPEREGDHEARMLEFATELHAILTPAQRAKLAEHVEAGGPMFFMGKHGKRGPHGDHHDGHGPHGEGPDGVEGPHGDPAERAAHHVERLCEKVTCTAEQRTELTQVFVSAKQARHEQHESREKPDFSAVGALLRADTLDAAKLSEVLAAGKAEHHARKAEHHEAFGETLAQVHAILTPEQRAIVADAIEADGLRSLMGGKHGKHGKHGKRAGHRG
jgi:Spy/CpxP family protein refolding chaperone